MILAEHLVDIESNASNRFRIYPIGDCHANLKTFDRYGLKRYVKMIENDPHCVVVGMGDMSDARSREHKFFEPAMLHPSYTVEDLDHLDDLVIEELVDIFKPIAPKIVGFLRGNHHRPGFTRNLVNALNRKARIMTVQDLGDRTMIRVRVNFNATKTPRTQILYIFATHHDSAGRKPGGQINYQLDTSLSFDADVYLFGHSHRPSWFEQPRMKLNKKGPLVLLPHNMHFVNAGAWLQQVVVQANSYTDSRNLPVHSRNKIFLDVRRRRDSLDETYEDGKCKGKYKFGPNYWVIKPVIWQPEIDDSREKYILNE